MAKCTLLYSMMTNFVWLESALKERFNVTSNLMTVAILLMIRTLTKINWHRSKSAVGYTTLNTYMYAGLPTIFSSCEIFWGGS